MRSSPKTIAFYRDNVERAFGGWIAARGVSALDAASPHDIRLFLGLERQRLAPETYLQRFQSVRRFFAWAVENHYLRVSPMEGMRRPRVEVRRRVAFERAEVKAMAETCANRPGWIGTRDRALLAVLVGTGARASEVVAMRLGDVDWSHRQIWLHGKGGRDRAVPMGAGVHGPLLAYRRLRERMEGIPSDALWITLRRDVMSYGTLEAFTRGLGRELGIKPCNPHRFRHTYASEHYRQNRDLRATQSGLGHQSPTMTSRYLAALGASYAVESGAKSPADWLL